MCFDPFPEPFFRFIRKGKNSSKEACARTHTHIYIGFGSLQCRSARRAGKWPLLYPVIAHFVLFFSLGGRAGRLGVVTTPVTSPGKERERERSRLEGLTSISFRIVLLVVLMFNFFHGYIHIYIWMYI